MHSHKPRPETYSPPLMVQHYPADSPALCERVSVAALLQHHLLIALELRGCVKSLEMRLQNISFIDVRQLFHRIGESTEQCCNFLDARIHDLVPFSGPHPSISKSFGEIDRWYDLSFAACTDHISEHARSLSGFAVQIKGFMDQAVINGDYNSLHVMTDCVYQISQLVALIQIHLPVDSLTAPAAPPAPLDEYS